jgi:hypothetical protein
MSLSNAFETSLLSLIFANSNIANIGDATGLRGSVTAGNLHIALHTADPGEAGTQTTNECAYTGYARVAMARTSSWTVSGNSASPAATISFNACTGGTETATHFSIGVASTGGGVILFKGAITPNISIYTGVTPQLGTGTAVTFD